MKLIVVILFIGTVFNSISQSILPELMDTNDFSSELIIRGTLDYSGTSIRNDFSDQFVYGGFIDGETKDKSMDRHRALNKYGVESFGEIVYKSYDMGNFLKGKYGYYVKAGINAYASTSYSKDAFGLLFYGNNRYLGDTAKFSGSEVNGVVFQKIGFGFVSKKSKSSIGVNYYNISNYGNAFVRQGELSSDDAGSSLVMDVDARAQFTSGKSLTQGWGVGFDGDFRFKAQWMKNTEVFFQAQFNNIGLMHLSAVNEMKIDSSYSFSGFKYNQLFGDQNITIEDNSDLLDTLGVSRDTIGITTFLPGFIQIGKIVDENSNLKLQSFFGVRMYTGLAYNPLIYIGGQYQPYSWFKVGLQAMYGGFSNFRMGFYTQYQYKKITFGIGSENIIGALSKSGTGQSIHARLAIKW